MNVFKRFKKAWKAETPLFWVWVAGASAFVCAAVPTLAAVNIPGLAVPEVFTNNAWIIFGAATVVGTFAKTRIKPPVPKKKKGAKS